MSLFAVVCTPECENGACVANDTCACSKGFSGDTCDQKCKIIQVHIVPIESSLLLIVIAVIEECEENPCENGGSCTKHVSDYLCTCLPGYTGTLCQGKSRIIVNSKHN